MSEYGLRPNIDALSSKLAVFPKISDLLMKQRCKFLFSAIFKFVGHPLYFSNIVSHLGHILNFSLGDSTDVARVISDMNKKANYLLCAFSSCDPLVKTGLICLSFYDCVS